MDRTADKAEPLNIQVDLDGTIYRELFTNATEPFFILEDGRITDCNPAAEKQFGYSRMELIGKRPIDFSPPRQPDGTDSAEAAGTLLERLRSEKEIRFEWEFISGDGGRRITEVSMSRIGGQEREIEAAVVRDISREKRNAALREVLFNISQATNLSGDLRELLAIIHAELSTLIDTGNFYVALYNPETDTYSIPYGVDEEDYFDPDEEYELPGSLTEYVRVTGEPLFCDQAENRRLMEQGKIELVGSPSEQWLGVPLRIQEEVIGVVAVQSYQTPDLYTRDDLALLEFVADHAALAIDRKRKEDALRFSEYRYRILFNRTPVGIATCDMNLVLTDCNDRFIQIFRSTREQIIGTDLSTLKHRRLIELVRRALQGETVHYEGPYHTLTSDCDIFISCTIVPQYNAGGILVGAIGAVLDTTERQKAVRELEIQKAYLEELFESAPEAIAILDNDDRILRINREFTRLFGYSEEETVGSLINDLIVPEKLKDEGLQATSKVARGERVFLETLRQRKGGRKLEVSILGNPIRLGEDQIGVYGIYRDISKRKRAERALREREEQLRNIVNSINAALWSVIIDKHTNKHTYTLFTESIERITGYTRKEHIKSGYKTRRKMVHPDDAEMFDEFYRNLRPGKSAGCEYRIFTREGELRWLLDVVKPIEIGDESVFQVNGVTFNISERRLAQESLAEEKERLAVTLRSIGDAVISTDVHGRVQLMNPPAEELTGWEFSRAKGKSIDEVMELVDVQTGERMQSPVDEVLRTGQIIASKYEGELVLQDGSRRVIADSAAPIKDSNSRIIGAVLVFRDVTEKRRLEKEVLRAQKLESLGLLAGGVAHDFNNILSAILGNITLARFRSKSWEFVDEKLELAERAAFRAKDLTRQLLTFSRGGTTLRKATSLRELIEEAAEFVLSGANVECRLNIPDDLWNAEVDQGQFTQVVQNLLINALQAMPEGGHIEIRAKNVRLSGSQSIPLPPGKYILIEFEDEGTGIDKRFINKIFDPYFTTKQKGSGLGLASSYSIIKKHDGHILVDSEHGKGTTFSIYLPHTEKEAVRTDESSPGSKKGEGRILVMDDEDYLLEVLSEMLPILGYRVECAVNGDQAYEMYLEGLRKGDRFDAVIFDLTIPGGMGGKETLEKLIKIDPDIRAIVSSGYSNDAVMSNYMDYGFKGVVAKPYLADDLARILDQVLNKD